MNGVVYAMVSTSAQRDDGTSLHTQVEACLKLAQSLGIHVAPDCILRDQGPGADSFRPGMVALRSALERSKANRLFVYRPDLLSRDPYDLMAFREYLDTLGVQWHFVHGPKGNTPEDRLIGYLSGCLGQLERAEIAEPTRRGKVEVARRGRLPIGTGKGLYGYDYDSDCQKRLINEVEAAIVRWIFQCYVDGMTTHAIAAELNRTGIKTKRGTLCARTASNAFSAIPRTKLKLGTAKDATGGCGADG